MSKSGNYVINAVLRRFYRIRCRLKFVYLRLLYENDISMRKIYNNEDFKEALKNKEQNVVIENIKLSYLLVLVYRVQNGLIPEAVIDRIKPDRPCKVAVGEGVVIDVDDILAKKVLSLNQQFEESKIELDVAQVVNTQINLFYGK